MVSHIVLAKYQKDGLQKMAKTIKLSTLMAANAAVKDIDLAQKALAGLKSDYVKKSLLNGLSFYTSSSCRPQDLIQIPLDVIQTALEAMVEGSKVKLDKLGVEIDA